MDEQHIIGNILFPILAVDCLWGEWVSGDCSTTCGIGSRVNTRIKIVDEANGGSCTGQPTETEECNLQECAGSTEKQYQVVREKGKCRPHSSNLTP